MEYLLTMSLSGTVMAGICVLVRFGMKSRISGRFEYLLAKAAILYYLMPLSELGKCYKQVLDTVTDHRVRSVTGISPRRSFYVIYANEHFYTSHYMKIQIVVAITWVLGAAFVFLFELMDYYRTGKRLEKDIKRMNVSAETRKIERGRGAFRFRKKVTVYRDVPSGKSMAFGLFHPVIILCERKAGTEKEEYILQHELTHVRRIDVLWKALLHLTTILHWWNPIVWYLYHDFERVCECSCDEEVLRGKTREEKKEYLCLVVIEAGKKPEGKIKSINSRLGVGFELGKEAKKIEERIENAMNMKKWSGMAAMLTVAILVMVNSLTVLAYPEVYTETLKEDVPEEQIEQFLEADLCQFVSEEADEEEKKRDLTSWVKQIEVRYEQQFLDINGNIFPINDTTSESLYRSCSHNYVSGTIDRHKRNADGSCILTTYSAERCSKCGHVITGNRLYSINFDICPH